MYFFFTRVDRPKKEYHEIYQKIKDKTRNSQFWPFRMDLQYLDGIQYITLAEFYFSHKNKN